MACSAAAASKTVRASGPGERPEVLGVVATLHHQQAACTEHVVEVGERVAGFPLVGCGVCEACDAGATSKCLQAEQLGLQRRRRHTRAGLQGVQPDRVVTQGPDEFVVLIFKVKNRCFGFIDGICCFFFDST